MSASYDIVIVGAGHGGAQAAVALQQQKFPGTIALIGDEPDLLDERPPLSKGCLAGEKPFERRLIHRATFWTERRDAILLGRRVIPVDAPEVPALSSARRRRARRSRREPYSSSTAEVGAPPRSTARRRTDTPTIVSWYMNGQIAIEPTIIPRLTVDETNNAFDLMPARSSIRAVVVYRWSS